MNANWIVVSAVILAAIALVVFLARQDRKDRKDYEKYLKDQSRPKDEADRDDGL